MDKFTTPAGANPIEVAFFQLQRTIKNVIVNRFRDEKKEYPMDWRATNFYLQDSYVDPLLRHAGGKRPDLIVASIRDAERDRQIMFVYDLLLNQFGELKIKSVTDLQDLELVVKHIQKNDHRYISVLTDIDPLQMQNIIHEGQQMERRNKSEIIKMMPRTKDSESTADLLKRLSELCNERQREIIRLAGVAKTAAAKDDFEIVALGDIDTSFDENSHSHRNREERRSAPPI